MKYVLGFIHTPDTTEERISILQDRPTEIIQRGKKKKKNEKGKREKENRAPEVCATISQDYWGWV